MRWSVGVGSVGVLAGMLVGVLVGAVGGAHHVRIQRSMGDDSADASLRWSVADVPRQPALPVVRLAAAVMTACKVSAVVVALGAMALHIATWGRDSWAATLGAGSVGAAAWVGVAMLRGARPGTLRELRRAVLRAAVVRSVLGLVLAVCAWLVFRPEPAPLVGAFVLAAVWCVAIEAGYLMVVRRRGPG